MTLDKIAKMFEVTSEVTSNVESHTRHTQARA
jgi:hypothetical protein